MRARGSAPHGLPGGVYNQTGQPLMVPQRFSVKCPACDAPIGERCRVWVIAGGERQRIKNYCPHSFAHPARRAAIKEASCSE